MAKITVQNTQITVIKQNEDDYISLTDMLKAKDGEFFFSNWLRNRNTIEFLGIWERLMNPNFNCAEFDIIKSQAGLNRFRLSAKEWTEKTNAIGIISKAGRYGGTYAHKDIAFEFAMCSQGDCPHVSTPGSILGHEIKEQTILQTMDKKRILSERRV